MTEYIVWNYETNEAAKYERSGECNGCGQCCIAEITFLVAQPKPDFDGRELGKSTDEKGVWCEVDTGNDRRFFKVTEIKEIGSKRCLALGDDMQCTKHKEKPRICSVWPVTPSQVTPFPDCSYEFSEVLRWEFE